MTRLFTNLCLILCFVVTVCFAGCDSGKLKTWPVEGEVTFDGKPFDEGMIRFHPKVDDVGRSAYGAVKNGRYKIQTAGGDFEAGTMPGEYSVTFSRLVAPKTAPRTLGDGSVEEPESVETLPKFYTNREATQFSATVVKGKNVFNFELTSKP